MKFPILFALILISTILSGQINESKTDLRIGIGTAILGTGDFSAIVIENELNYEVHPYLGIGGSMAFGKSYFTGRNQSSFIQGNVNIFFSPFTNKKTNDFRIGSGFVYNFVSDVYQSSSEYLDGVLIDEDYRLEDRTSLGVNIILENTVNITNKFLLGLKLFSQPYLNGDINSGLILKAGFKI